MRPILLHNNWHLIILFALCPDLTARNNQVSATRKETQSFQGWCFFPSFGGAKKHPGNNSCAGVTSHLLHQQEAHYYLSHHSVGHFFFNATSSKTSSAGRVIVTSGKWFCGRATRLDSAEVKYNKQRLCLSPILNRHHFIFFSSVSVANLHDKSALTCGVSHFIDILLVLHPPRKGLNRDYYRPACLFLLRIRVFILFQLEPLGCKQ